MNAQFCVEIHNVRRGFTPARGQGDDQHRDCGTDRGNQHAHGEPVLRCRIRQQHNREIADNGRRRNGGEFAPDIDSPPVPSRNQHGRHRSQNNKNVLVGAQNAVQLGRDQQRRRGERKHADARSTHIVPFRAAGADKGPVDIVDDVRSAPVEMGVQSAHKRRQQRRDHNAFQAHRKQRIDHARIDRLRIGNVGKVDQRGQTHDDPRPAANRQVAKTEPVQRQHRVALASCRQGPLQKIAGSRRVVPPSDQQEYRKAEGFEVVVERRKQPHGLWRKPRRRPQCRYESALRREIDVGDHRQRDGAEHGQAELNQVGVDHAVQSREGGVEHRDRGEAHENKARYRDLAE